MENPNNNVEAQLECASCPWDRPCIRPPRMTKEQVESKIKEETAKDGEKGLMGGLLTVMIFGGKDLDCEACPVFIAELRKGPEMSNQIKQLMKEK